MFSASAAFEGNQSNPSGFYTGGKPILVNDYECECIFPKPIWTYDQELDENNMLKTLTIYKKNTPWWIFHAKDNDIRKLLKSVFDISSLISETLPDDEIYSFLTMHHILMANLRSSL
jgi:hypothetical protein